MPPAVAIPPVLLRLLEEQLRTEGSRGGCRGRGSKVASGDEKGPINAPAHTGSVLSQNCSHTSAHQRLQGGLHETILTPAHQSLQELQSSTDLDIGRGYMTAFLLAMGSKSYRSGQSSTQTGIVLESVLILAHQAPGVTDLDLFLSRLHNVHTF
eukprot:scaffold63720_cov22-Tisochrysis_lutea.AAC.3